MATGRVFGTRNLPRSWCGDNMLPDRLNYSTAGTG